LASVPLIVSVVGLPVIAWLALRRMPPGASKGFAWIACAVAYPVLTYVVCLVWVGAVAAGDPVPQGALATGFMASIVAFIVAFGLLGHGLTIVLESRKPSRGESGLSDPVDSR
jgi:hypothetical protein